MILSSNMGLIFEYVSLIYDQIMSQPKPAGRIQSFNHPGSGDSMSPPVSTAAAAPAMVSSPAFLRFSDYLAGLFFFRRI